MAEQFFQCIELNGHLKGILAGMHCFKVFFGHMHFMTFLSSLRNEGVARKGQCHVCILVFVLLP